MSGEIEQRGRQQVKVGTVLKSSMDKTVVVTVDSIFMHRLYHRSMKRTSKFYAHDEKNECRPGDRVQIVSTRPMSKLKRWRVQRVLTRSEEG